MQKIKIIDKMQILSRFNKVFEYVLQMPSLSGSGHRAAVTREMVHTSNSVIVLIHAKDSDSFLLCEEYRTGVFFNEAFDDDPLLLQCVAGMIDKGRSAEDVARAEALEEAGVTVGEIEPIAAVYASPGRITEKVHLFFAPVESAAAGVFGLEDEGEEIRTRLIPRAEIYRMMDERKILDSMTLLALNWFRRRFG